MDVMSVYNEIQFVNQPSTCRRYSYIDEANLLFHLNNMDIICHDDVP